MPTPINPLELAEGPVSAGIKSAAHYTALFPAVFDNDGPKATNRTYQLVKRDSDAIPHMLSASGQHADALLPALNRRAAISFERSQLKDAHALLTPEQRKAGAAALKSADDALAAESKSLLSVRLTRTPDVTRGLTVYSARGTQPATV